MSRPFLFEKSGATRDIQNSDALAYPHGCRIFEYFLEESRYLINAGLQVTSMDELTTQNSMGVDAAFLIEKYQAGLWRYLRSLGASPDLADDLTQATFLAVLKSRFVHEAWPKTWSFLRRVAYNLYIDLSLIHI